MVQTEMNTIFNTGYQGSDPKLYNTHIRSWIAGTNGDNIGTVFPDVKCMEGCGNEIAFFEGKVTNVKKESILVRQVLARARYPY